MGYCGSNDQRTDFVWKSIEALEDSFRENPLNFTVEASLRTELLNELRNKLAKCGPEEEGEVTAWAGYLTDPPANYKHAYLNRICLPQRIQIVQPEVNIGHSTHFSDESSYFGSDTNPEEEEGLEDQSNARVDIGIISPDSNKSESKWEASPDGWRKPEDILSSLCHDDLEHHFGTALEGEVHDVVNDLPEERVDGLRDRVSDPLELPLSETSDESKPDAAVAEIRLSKGSKYFFPHDLHSAIEIKFVKDDATPGTIESDENRPAWSKIEGDLKKLEYLSTHGVECHLIIISNQGIFQIKDAETGNKSDYTSNEQAEYQRRKQAIIDYCENPEDWETDRDCGGNERIHVWEISPKPLVRTSDSAS